MGKCEDDGNGRLPPLARYEVQGRELKKNTKELVAAAAADVRWIRGQGSHSATERILAS